MLLPALRPRRRGGRRDDDRPAVPRADRPVPGAGPGHGQPRPASACSARGCWPRCGPRSTRPSRRTRSSPAKESGSPRTARPDGFGRCHPVPGRPVGHPVLPRPVPGNARRATAPRARPPPEADARAGRAASRSAPAGAGALREYLQSVIEEQESTNEELKCANEEILSANEELQSTNEELQTAKEEPQSANEELTTVNEELRHRNAELGRVNNDLVNLLTGVSIPIVMVGRDLRIRRFTPLAEKVFNLIPTDVGRPISDIKPNLKLDDFPGMIAKVIDTVTSFEGAVQDLAGHWYSLRIRPYITLENKIDGASIVLVDVDSIRRPAQA